MITLVGVLTAASVLLMVAPRHGVPSDPTKGLGPSAPPQRALLARLRVVLALVAAGGGWAMFGGVFGVTVGVGCAVTVWVVLGRVEDPAAVRRREVLVMDLPTGVDLLGACLDAGAAIESAMASVSDALEGPVAEEFSSILHRLDIGIDPTQVWRGVARDSQLGALGRAIGRAHETGAPVGQAVQRLAEELRERAQADVETRARSIEVKAAAPLGLCLLPAFVLLGIVPMVVGVFTAMQLFR